MHFAVVDCFLEFNRFNGVHFINVRDDRFIVRRNQLSTAGPIDFDRVVAGWVVAGGYHDATIALLVTDQKRELGRAAVVVQKVNLKPIGHHDARTKLGELTAAMPSVVGDGDRPRAVRFDFLDIVGQPLSAFADGAIVDGVRTERVHHASPASGAEGDHCPEHVVQLLPFFVLYVFGNRWRIGRVPAFGKP